MRLRSEDTFSTENAPTELPWNQQELSSLKQEGGISHFRLWIISDNRHRYRCKKCRLINSFFVRSKSREGQHDSGSASAWIFGGHPLHRKCILRIAAICGIVVKARTEGGKPWLQEWWSWFVHAVRFFQWPVTRVPCTNSLWYGGKNQIKLLYVHHACPHLDELQVSRSWKVNDTQL